MTGVFLFSLLASHTLAVSRNATEPLKILVFGDSQGDVGPTYKVLEDQLKQHDRAGTVINAAIGGTLSCGWAKDPKAVAKAAAKAFGLSGPHLVWLTVGGNDMAGDSKYHVSTMNCQMVAVLFFFAQRFVLSVFLDPVVASSSANHLPSWPSPSASARCRGGRQTAIYLVCAPTASHVMRW